MENFNNDPFACIDHVGYAVKDMDEAIKFHTEVLGFHVLLREKNPGHGVEEAMIATGKRGEESTVVQLLAPLGEDTNIAKNKNMIQQVCYRTYDIDKTIATLKERGARFISDEPSLGTAGSRVVFLHPKCTGGILVEITEPPAGGMPYKD
ncbi:MAG: methylmalonyl-CoA epimerase [Acidipropionibacterium jensenii]|nr:methylmalonyl-CoA epimerase [Acidipropionibacterium jensenii]